MAICSKGGGEGGRERERERERERKRIFMVPTIRFANHTLGTR